MTHPNPDQLAGGLEDALTAQPGETLESREAKRLLSALLMPLSHLFAGEVTEVMINRHDDIWVEDRAGMRRVDCTLPKDAVETAIVALGRLAGIDAGDQCPIVDARVGRHLRVGAVLEPAAVEGPTLCIRRHVPMQASLAMYGEIVRQETLRLLEESRNVLVAGATGSGKTTFINALLAELPPTDRLIVIEDTPELTVPNPNRVRFESRGGADMSALLREALRQRPDRIVLGEIRGREAYDLLQAFNTGHGGSFSTIHAGSPAGALLRLASLVGQAEEARSWPQSAIRSAIAASVGGVVCLRKKQVVAVASVEGLDDTGFVLENRFEAGIAKAN
ncbi:hypothetical protein BI364_06970 [Acidihalobacter yilgarnensis]|uniref:Bacterial type II secretion system protein E domain-containing protein n=1 Tax=Acidihalobacter yilgarnensis TaxID=2819280 RepID=A0A1D8IMN7_9GAMM|nr:ATPase, T2SS/T4P/T4SS family [Acidihalobacter yilgarnensis]AOU97733.1 hypothetical protein BI364_06970 [Acidihalobacter yilgarnensis]